MSHKVTHSAALEPPEVPECELCEELLVDCECDTYYVEEKDYY
jgi:hypothetical protein